MSSPAILISKRLVSCLLAMVVTAELVHADEELDPQPIIEGRQSALRDIGAAFKGVNDELKKSVPSLPLLRQYVRQIDDLARQQQLWFPPGTGPESDIETAAKADIWQQPAQFKAAQAAFGEHVAKLVTVASGSDIAAIKSQSQALGRTCKGCHEKFREDDD